MVYDNHNYAYIVGRLRALETQMMNQNLLERLLDAKDADEAYRALNDMPLVMDHIADHGVQEFNKVLLGALQAIKQLFIQMAPYPEALSFLWFKYDFHNLKVILKAKLTERGYADVSHALIDLGTVTPENWEKYLLEDKKIETIPAIGDTIATATASYEKTPDPQAIDLLVDQHYLDILHQIADTLDSDLIKRYLCRIIDFSNLRAFMRCLELKKDLSYLETVLAFGGHLDRDVFLGSFDRGYDELRQALESRMHADDLLVAFDEFMDNKYLLGAEKKAYELQQTFMEDSKRIAFGPEPVFAFFWRFENQLHIIRTVLVGKLNSLSVEEIHSSLLPL